MSAALAARLVVARAALLEVERAAIDAYPDDDQLDAELHLARYGLLGAIDRVQQLRLDGIAELERNWFHDPDEEAVA